MPSDQGYVTRGIVGAAPSWTVSGRFALLRGNMVCCLADAIAMGMMVAADGLPALRDGDWVVVFGRVRLLPDPSPDHRPGRRRAKSLSRWSTTKPFWRQRQSKKWSGRVFRMSSSCRRPARDRMRLTGGDDVINR
ncbi:MAG: hypothetical protein MZV70_56505 [Desulfobacterales bacterium]|nr:hypothetical protein [Desulfobacterales bacterium]